MFHRSLSLHPFGYTSLRRAVALWLNQHSTSRFQLACVAFVTTLVILYVRSTASVTTLPSEEPEPRAIR
eukprot:4711222-Pleurochrysis_carterae.AAC.1